MSEELKKAAEALELEIGTSAFQALQTYLDVYARESNAKAMTQLAQTFKSNGFGDLR